MLSDTELLASGLPTIEKVARRLAPRYTFGHFDEDDIFQEGIIIGMSGILHHYDSERPLENFMSVHMKNRLHNFRRNNYIRYDTLCVACKHLLESQYCDMCKNKLRVSNAKKNVIDAITLDLVDDEEEPSMSQCFNVIDEVELDNMVRLIDIHLPITLREDYLRLLDGVSIPRNRREKVENAITELLTENGYEAW